MSLNVIKQLAERELSEINGTPLVTIISLNVINNDDDYYIPELNHLYVNAAIDNAEDEECDGPHPWDLVWDSDEDMFVSVMRLDQNEDDDEDNDELNEEN